MLTPRVMIAGLLTVLSLAITAGVIVARGPMDTGRLPVQQAVSVGTAFTYQGRLTQEGIPANGPFDFKFTLYDTLEAGNQISVPVEMDGVPVSDGLFTVSLDFGDDAFNGKPRWLEVAVKSSKADVLLKTLSPRQSLSPTPYAIYAANAWSLDGNSDTSPDTDFLGTIDEQPLVIKTNGAEVLRITSDGKVGIGTDDPKATLHVVGDLAVGEGTTLITEDGITVSLKDFDGQDSGRITIMEDGVSVFDAEGNLISHFNEKGSTHRALEIFEGGVEFPLLDDDGKNVGAIIIDKSGLRVSDAQGNLISSVDEDGSVHNKKETFKSIVVHLVDSEGNPSGQIQLSQDGLAIFDKNDKLLSFVNETGSEHLVSEKFSEIRVPLIDEDGIPSGTVVVNKNGIQVLDENGDATSKVDAKGSSHLLTEVFADIRIPTFFGEIILDPGGITVPLGNPLFGTPPGKLVISINGLQIYDKDGNLASSVDHTGSVHNKPERFNTITVPLKDGDGNPVGTITIGEDGFVVEDLAGKVIVSVDENGLSGITSEELTKLKIPLKDINGTKTGDVVIDKDGVSILDADGNIVSKVNEAGSIHNKPERFEGGISVSITDEEGNEAGDVKIGPGGIRVFDKDNNLVSLTDATGSLHNKVEVFAGGLVSPLKDKDGNLVGTIILQSDGLFVNDEEGNTLIRLGRELSEHNVPELFNAGVFVPLKDEDGNLTGSVEIKSDGLSVFDADGNLISSVDSTGSKHNAPEEFSEIKVALKDDAGNPLGTAVIDKKGFRILDVNGNEVSRANEAGSKHRKGEIFSAISVQILDDSGEAKGEILIDKDGLQVFDLDGNLIVSADETGLTGAISQELTEISIPLKSDTGTDQGKVVIDKDGIRVLDTFGSVISRFDEDGSEHNAPEQFSKITVPMFDIDENPHQMIIDADGLRIVDQFGKVISALTPIGSVHRKPETFLSGLSANLSDFNGDPTAAGVALNGTGVEFTDIEDTEVASIAVTEDQALEFEILSERVLRFENLGDSPNIIGGHSGNTVTALAIGATIAGGGSDSNFVTDNFGFVGGGDNNQAGNGDLDPTNAPYATVSGGLGNVALGDRSTVAGGFNNQATDTFAFVGGGELNKATMESSTVSGGDNNSATAIEATVAGGGTNEASGGGATVGGGLNNISSGFHATISGGESNTSSDTHTTVGGGFSNTADQDYGTVGGGRNNFAGGFATTIGGGSGNTATSQATVGGGEENNANGQYATIGGGRSNTITASYATIGGGGRTDPNDLATANRVEASYGTVGGGGNNQAGNGLGTEYATVSGGSQNVAENVWSTVGGGNQNQARGLFSTVGGGNGNIASGQSSTIPGGVGNSAEGRFSFAAGFRSKIAAAHDGAILLSDWNSFSFDSQAANEFAVRATGGARIVTSIDGNGAPVTTAVLNAGSGTWTSASDRSIKANFSPVDGKAIVRILSEVPIETWNYKSQDESVQHIGPMSQDFFEAFSVGKDNRFISTVDADGVALAAIQGLFEITQEQAAKLTGLVALNNVLQGQVTTLEARLTDLEQNVTRQNDPGTVSLSTWMPILWALLGGLAVTLAGLRWRRHIRSQL